MLADGLDQPSWQRNSAPPGGALGKRLERSVAAHLDDRPDHPELAHFQIQGVIAESGDLAPSKPTGASCGDECPVSLRDDW